MGSSRVVVIVTRLLGDASLLKNLQKNEHLCYDMVVTNTLPTPPPVDPSVCTCGESYAGVVIAFHGVIEHHLRDPFPCWDELRPVAVER